MKLISKCLLLCLFLIIASNLMAYDEKDFYRALEEKTCIKCDLYRASFSGVDLSYADFSGSNLIGANFQNATLYKANLSDANISGANFEGALWLDGQICLQGSYGKCVKKSSD